ncbi:MAG: hypothetical protein QNJ51_22570 [Calothrix sp. MO_167.B12]|nr:hypothetical protein [Calothrix sp. MO_167.B12]
MTVQDLQKQALELPIKYRWRLVQFLLKSIQKETLSSISPGSNIKTLKKTFKDLHPWTQSLVGAIQLGAENP